MSLVPIDYINQSATFHIMIGDKEHQGKGLGTFATQEMLKHAFYNMNVHRVESEILEYNSRSKHVHEKCGFVYEGCKRNAVYKNGRFVNVLQYSVLRGDYFPGGRYPLIALIFQCLNSNQILNCAA